MNIINSKNAKIFLLLNSIFWGSSYIWAKMLLTFLPRFAVLFICSVCAAIVTLIIFYKKLGRFSAKAVLISILVSLVSVLSNTFCMLALERTSGSNTAFIVQLSVVITPIIMAFFNRKLPPLKTLLLALLALFGIFFITLAGKGFTINLGDLFALLNAIFFSLFMAFQNVISKKVNAVQFTLIQHITNSISFLILGIAFSEFSKVIPHNLLSTHFILLIAINTLVVIFTALSQSKAISYVKPETAAILYTFEPVVTLFLAVLLLGEKYVGLFPIVGCALVLFSVVLSSIKLPHIKLPHIKKEAAGIYPATSYNFKHSS